MTLSDLLTFVGIVLAIFAFLSERERTTIVLKFTQVEKRFAFPLLFLIIIYLILFDEYFYPWNIYFEPTVRSKGFAASVYAFFISFALVIYILFQIAFGKYPKANTEKLLGFYKRWLSRNEPERVLDFIEKNHLQMIENYLDQRSSEYKRWRAEKNIVKEDSEFEKLNDFFQTFAEEKYDRTTLWLLLNVISNEGFIKSTVTYSPDFFINILQRSKFPSETASVILRVSVETLLEKRHTAVRSRFVIGSKHLTWLPLDNISTTIFDVFRNKRMYWFDDSELLFIYGKRLLHDPSNSDKLKTQFHKDLHHEYLNSESILDIIYLFWISGQNSIDHHLSSKWYSNIVFITALENYGRIILGHSRVDEREKGPWDNWYSNFGLELIVLIGQIFYDLIYVSVKKGNQEYVERIIGAYLQILFDLEMHSTPKQVKQRVYEPFFNIYVAYSKGDTDETAAKALSVVRQKFEDVLKTKRPIYKEKEFKEGIKELWEFSDRHNFSHDDRQKLGDFIKTFSNTKLDTSNL